MYDSIRLMVGGLAVAKASPLGLLSQEMVMRNYVAYKYGDSQAFEALVAHYGYLAFEKAFRLFHRLGDEARDLAQELLLTVVEVLKKPLPAGNKNLTFWVNVALDRKVREYLTQDSVGTYRENRLLKKLVAVRLELEGSLGRTPTPPELAQALGVDEATLERLLYLEEANRILSLSAPHPETGTRLEEMVAVEFEDELEEALEKARLGLKPEELSTLDRFLAGEEVEQAALDALAATLKARMVA
ncbi:putative RNA polymerase, sigma 28 subunit, FliA/WhiG subfamily [Allomeiothermus silvanus DSM 9946]|uniref:RNA polymerase, sigma 28 subunit, FliA/WhiG subfamily n=1 Tax=Allomeiothermus silvanus (strain ATCC 700542 / DSM 9946 / NBRC 106475 / NCIMB 13440 / VI-R2) TaxID=526227 RepID=D7BA24_ALLS1|nr:sigma-70 domain-containing protein [Allomeiothermus silvanus]ADH62458.1 putative RNA polymerase, sigma 28 subunit, FliA/WhiG subfamily [Allomeiothermus silvanus DSM 9946]